MHEDKWIITGNSIPLVIGLLVWDGMVRWTPAAPLSHGTKYFLIKSSYLEHGTIGMDACCVPDVILQSLHLISNSSRAVNIDVDMFEACQILQTKTRPPSHLNWHRAIRRSLSLSSFGMAPGSNSNAVSHQ